MDPHRFDSHSFVIKLWIEQTAEEADEALWAGRISHVCSNDHRYVRHLRDVIDYLGPYLLDLGVAVDDPTLQCAPDADEPDSLDAD